MPCAVHVFSLREAPQMPALAAEEARTVVVCQRTHDFRHLARRWSDDGVLRPGEAVFDVGCSTGATTAVLAKRFPGAYVLGLDISPEAIAAARANVPGVDFLQTDGLLCKEQVLELVRAKHATALWVDIGGDRELDTVVVFLAYLLRSIAGRLTLVVKSQTLYRQARVDGASALDEAWLDGLVSQGSARLQSRRLAHPQRYPLKLDPADGVTPICRYFNYLDECKKGSACPYSHATCHHCLQAGHRAVDCDSFLNDLPVGSYRSHAMRKPVVFVQPA